MRIDRRRLLIGGGGAAGLVVAYALWPREYPPGLPAAEGEAVFGGWLKIGRDGHIVVAVPQLEHGQGVYTALPQIVADELGADWRTVGVEAAPEAALYANPLAAETLFGPAGRTLFARGAPMLTGGATSVRQFEEPLRQAGAAARALLCKAAVRRWGGDWASCTTAAGFVTLGDRRARFGDLAADAARESVPGLVPSRTGAETRVTGIGVPRLDAPAKVDGSANFAGDIRLPDMLFASIRQGPVGDSRLRDVDRAAAERIPGVSRIVTTDRWVAAVGETWWAANRALGVLHPRFATPAPLVDDAGIAAALAQALGRTGEQVTATVDVSQPLPADAHRANYHVAAGVGGAIEPVTATASFEDGRLILWLATAAPGLARAAAARAAGLAEGDVVLHPMMAGGGFGGPHDPLVAEQAATLAVALRRPVQLTWSRAESLMRQPVRPPALIRLAARQGAGGAILDWRADVASQPLGHAIRARLAGDAPTGADAVAVDGAMPPYRVPAAVAHHPVDLPLPVGWTPGGAAVATCFATESFVDELARRAGAEPLSYRIGMLGNAPRLARCLSTIAALGGWQGGVAGSGQGIAAYAARGSFIALMVEGGMADGARPRIDRMVAAVDVGRAINPDLVRQVIEGGLIQGLAAATGATTGFVAGLATARALRDLRLPRLAETPDILIELIESDAAPGGAGDLAVPVVAPALANAIAAGSGARLRRLPLA